MKTVSTASSGTIIFKTVKHFKETRRALKKIGWCERTKNLNLKLKLVSSFNSYKKAFYFLLASLIYF